MFTIKIITTTEEFFNIKESWNNLLAQSPSFSIFLGWEWLYHWWTRFAHDSQLNIITVYDEHQDLVGIAPLSIRRQAIPLLGSVDILEFISTDPRQEDVCSEFMDYIVEQDRHEVIVSYLSNYIHSKEGVSWDVLLLNSLKSNAKILHNNAIIEQSCWHYAWPEVGYTHVDFAVDWEMFINQLSKRARRNTRKTIREFTAWHDCHVFIPSNNAEINLSMERLMTLHQALWQSRQEEGAFASSNICEFHLQIVKNLHQKNQLFLFCLKVHDQIEAVMYGFRFKDRVMMYQTGFNRHLIDSMDLGNMAWIFVMKYALEIGVKHVELLRGDVPYKQKWSKNQHEVKHHLLAKKSLKTWIYTTAKRLNKFLRTRIKEFIKDEQKITFLNNLVKIFSFHKVLPKTKKC